MGQRTILLTVIAFTFCWVHISAEEIHRKDTTILAGKYKLFFRSVTDDMEAKELNEEYFSDRSDNPVFINDLDSVLTLLGDEVKLQYHYYPDNETPFISSITCRNGMKVLFVELYGFSGYYPEKDIIVLQDGYYLTTGEKETHPQHVLYDKTNTIRIRYPSYYSYSHEIVLEKYEPSAKEFVPLINLKGLFGPDTMVVPFLREDNRLFIRIGTSWSELTLKATKKNAGFVEVIHEDGEPEEELVRIDTLLTYDDRSYRLQRIKKEEFLTLYNKYRRFYRPSIPMTDLQKVQKRLGRNYKFFFHHYSHNAISQIVYKDRIRYYPEEFGEFFGYYPREKILLYGGGHDCDMAFHILTFENAYNPGYSAVRKGDPYRMTGMHTGQESVEYRLEKWDKDKKEYRYLTTLRDLLGKLSSGVTGYMDIIYDPFWVRNTLYYRTGGEEWNGYAKYFALTIEE